MIRMMRNPMRKKSNCLFFLVKLTFRKISEGSQNPTNQNTTAKKKEVMLQRFLKKFLRSSIDDLDSLLNDSIDDIKDESNIKDDLDSHDSGSNDESSSELDTSSDKEDEDFLHYISGIIATILGYRSNDGDSGNSSTGSSSTGSSLAGAGDSVGDSLASDSVGSRLPGDSRGLPVDSGIENRAVNSWFSSLISKLRWVVEKMILKQLQYLCGTSMEYILNHMPDHMADILGSITTWSINFVYAYLARICLSYLIKYIRNVIAQINELNQITTLFSLSGFNTQNIIAPIEDKIYYINTHQWHDLEGENSEWEQQVNNPYLTSRFQKLVRQLGLMYPCCTRLSYLFARYFSYTAIGCGIKYLVQENPYHRFVSSVIQVRTCTFDKSIEKFVWGLFNILVYAGIGVVVWYRYIPFDHHPFIGIPPEVSVPLVDVNALKNPDVVINGYKRATFLITKDITNTVITTFQQDPTFKYILDIDYEMEQLDFENNIAAKHVLFNTCTAIIVATLIATKALVLPA